MNKHNPIKIQIIIAVLAALAFIPFLGRVHLFDWDEINFAEAAREMILTRNYLTVQINFQPFWEKPPLFIWMQVLSMKVFGINEFAARFPNAICGIATMLIIFNIGRKLRDNFFGVLWVLAFGGALLPFFYFKSGIIDPWFNLFIFLGTYFLMLYSFPDDKNKFRNILLSAVFIGLAFLTKGPVGFLLSALTAGVYLILIRFRIKIRFIEIVGFIIVLVVVGGSWFIIQILNGNFDLIKEFIVYQIRLFSTEDVGHGGFPGYHFVVLFFGAFPTSIIALKSFKKERLDDPLFSLMKKWMTILFWVVLILFSIVQTKIMHYSSLAYFPLSFLAANSVYQIKHDKQTWSRWQTILIVTISIVISILFISVPFIDKFKAFIIEKNLIHDQFTVGNLEASGGWRSFDILPGLLFFIAVIFIFTVLKKKDVLLRVQWLWVTIICFTFSIMLVIVPKVEKYTQAALIEYFQSLKGKDVYLKQIYFRSYATYFYGETKPPENKNYYDLNWLLLGDIDKDVYFATKIHRRKGLDGYSRMEEIGIKNGYAFYVRRAKTDNVDSDSK